MEAKHFNHCVDHGLKIYPVFVGFEEYKIVVAKLKNRKWVENMGAKSYVAKPKQKEEKWWEAIDKLYKHYYLMETDKEYKEKHLKNNQWKSRK